MENSEIDIINIIEDHNIVALKKWLENNGDPNLIAGRDNHKTSLIQHVLYEIDDSDHNEEIVYQMLNLLIQYGADPNAHLDDVYPILYAVIERKKSIVRLLLEANANIDVRDDLARTPLTSAVIDEDVELLKILLTQTNLESIDKIGGIRLMTPLAYALSKPNIEMIELLLLHGANPHINIVENGNLPAIENVPLSTDSNLKNQIFGLINRYYSHSS